jgi:hypothetical protein
VYGEWLARRGYLLASLCDCLSPAEIVLRELTGVSRSFARSIASEQWNLYSLIRCKCDPVVREFMVIPAFPFDGVPAKPTDAESKRWNKALIRAEKSPENVNRLTFRVIDCDQHGSRIWRRRLDPWNGLKYDSVLVYRKDVRQCVIIDSYYLVETDQKYHRRKPRDPGIPIYLASMAERDKNFRELLSLAHIIQHGILRASPDAIKEGWDEAAVPGSSQPRADGSIFLGGQAFESTWKDKKRSPQRINRDDREWDDVDPRAGDGTNPWTALATAEDDDRDPDQSLPTSPLWNGNWEDARTWVTAPRLETGAIARLPLVVLDSPRTPLLDLRNYFLGMALRRDELKLEGGIQPEIDQRRKEAAYRWDLANPPREAPHAAVKRRVELGWSVPSIAKFFKVSESTIYNRLRDIPEPPPEPLSREQEYIARTDFHERRFHFFTKPVGHFNIPKYHRGHECTRGCSVWWNWQVKRTVDLPLEGFCGLVGIPFPIPEWTCPPAREIDWKSTDSFGLSEHYESRDERQAAFGVPERLVEPPQRREPGFPPFDHQQEVYQEIVQGDGSVWLSEGQERDRRCEDLWHETRRVRITLGLQADDGLTQVRLRHPRRDVRR